ncbi:MAG: HlyC/CorC family transporter [Candidatus Aminicenantes bacterium]|nr:HlyC/CorC family transporter [Candidatus Aminicenantes bacterium]
MKIFIYILLFVITFIFYMLEISFRSFSKVSLAGFINDHQKRKSLNAELVGNYEMILNSLQSFSFFLQLSLFIFSYFLLNKTFDNEFFFIAILIFLFIFIFDFLIYMIAFFNREFILEKLIFLYRLPKLFFSPANFVFSIFLKKRVFSSDPEGDDLSEKELEVFIEEGQKEGVIEKEDTEMIESVLEFGDTLVKEIMTPRVDMIYIDREIKTGDLLSIIKKYKKSRYPVISGRVDNVEGIILSKDIFNYWNKKDFDISKLLRKPFFIPETMRVLELLKELQRSKQKFAVVVDEFGGISGVVTMEDIIEEIVGEIQDEYDEDIEQIIKEHDYYLVNGDTDIYELEDVIGIVIEDDEDFQTVSGLVSFKLGKIPRKNEKIVIYDHVFQVTEIEKNRILKVKIFHEKK